MADKKTTAPKAVAATGATSTTEESKTPVTTNGDSEAIILKLEQAVKAGLERESDLKSALESANLKIDAAAITVNELREQLTTVIGRASAAELELEQLKAANLEEVVEEAAVEPKTFVVYQDRQYGFTDKAPTRLNIDGHVRSQNELLNDEDAMISLIVGESAFVKQVF